MNSCKEIIKFIIYTCNTLLSVSSIALVIFGTLNIVEKHDITIHPFRNRFCIGNAALILGLVMLTVTILGYYANCSEKRQALFVYAILLIALFLAQISLGILVSITLHPSEEGFSKAIDQEFERQFKENNTQFFHSLDQIQKKYSCCGVHGPKDYAKIPPSCCNENCDEVYTQGCSKIYAHLIDTSYKVIGYISFVFSLPEPITAWLALLLRQISKSSDCSSP